MQHRLTDCEAPPDFFKLTVVIAAMIGLLMLGLSLGCSTRCPCVPCPVVAAQPEPTPAPVGDTFVISSGDESDGFDGRCPLCKAEGLTSTVRCNGFSSVTLMYCGDGFYDEKGNYYPPKRCNTARTGCSCSRGHTFSQTEKVY